jgi:hypothetical protein
MSEEVEELRREILIFKDKELGILCLNLEPEREGKKVAERRPVNALLELDSEGKVINILLTP